ncbi:hypothetical protein N0A02_11200 [Paraburkholderia acidicola]|uniref:Tfp pilus assembly protein PilO n=1 Tax=Paraburkholderia acidicola TaxID=1912599 RepID=A0ABV1LMN3_9BURK
MNPSMTTGIAPRRSTATSLERWLDRLRVPLDAWSGARRLAIALLVAAGVFVLGARSWNAVDLGGIAASHTALDDAQHRLASARHALAQLPVLRERVAVKARLGQPVVWTSADDVRAFSQLAARSGLVLVSLEPGAASGEGLDAMRSVKLAARGNFAQIMKFVRGLAGLPVLVVPADLTVKRHDDALEIATTLQVFSRLFPVGAGQLAPPDQMLDASDAQIDQDVAFHDPFSPQRIGDVDLPEAAQLRLVGLLRDDTHGLALVETAEGTQTVEPGQPFGEQRVTKIDALGLTLATRGGAHLLTLAREPE